MGLDKKDIELEIDDNRNRPGDKYIIKIEDDNLSLWHKDKDGDVVLLPENCRFEEDIIKILTKKIINK